MFFSTQEVEALWLVLDCDIVVSSFLRQLH